MDDELTWITLFHFFDGFNLIQATGKALIIPLSPPVDPACGETRQEIIFTKAGTGNFKDDIARSIQGIKTSFY